MTFILMRRLIAVSTLILAVFLLCDSYVNGRGMFNNYSFSHL